jgi:hypothetical protein
MITPFAKQKGDEGEFSAPDHKELNINIIKEKQT